MHPQIEHLKKLPVSEKLQVLEELWEDLSASAGVCPVPAWVIAEASRRADELKANPSIAISDQELWRRVDASLNDG